MEEFNGFLPVYTSREFDPRWFCVWEIFVLLSWGLQGDIWILDSQSLFVLIIQQNLEVPLQVDYRLSLFEVILSLNNKNMKKSQNSYNFDWYVHFVGTESGEGYHQPENFSYRKQCWGETNLEKHVKAFHGNTFAHLLFENQIQSSDI